ncbi:uncharacterized protein LOC119674777 [Teleopsis dalmanni]|uniref:uncharacterized protein LOC119674777 n=1 Tax=Teleopsis dalmanni TaxID=139649 RepID=UPI0018CD0E1E|nr:uncharacterized protein LOC119674777 [Teleopsis dalmanni]
MSLLLGWKTSSNAILQTNNKVTPTPTPTPWQCQQHITTANGNTVLYLIEAQFAVAAITSDITQFNTVVAAIESSVIADVSDAVLHPPETGRYANLKACIIERYSESEQRKIQRLLSEVELGDRRPTQLLTELTALAKDKVSDEFLKSLWLKRLPPQVRAILQASNVALAELAKLADRICEAGDFQQIAVASASDCPAYSENAVILRRLEQIEQRLSRLDLRRSESVQSRSSSRRRRRTRSRPGSHPDWCWYHERFGDRANACRQPCSFVASSHQSKN